MSIPTIDLAQTGANIVNLRKAAGLAVADIQMIFGFNSPQAIYKWQNGTALPTVDTIVGSSLTWPTTQKGDFRMEAAQHNQYSTKAMGMSILILPEIYCLFLWNIPS